MANFAVFRMICLLSSAQALQMCTTLDNIKGVEKGKFLPESHILNLTMPGIMTCSRACLMRRRCKSFNFNIETGECQLNSKTNISPSPQLRNYRDFVFSDISNWPERLAGICANHTCPLNSFCEPVNSTHHVCRVTGCPYKPTVVNGHLNEAELTEVNSFMSVLPYTCDLGYMPQGELVCQDDGTWSSPVCASVSSCSMVKQYQPNSDAGEYWLRLTSFHNYTTKIYCHDMSTSSPQEFLTLHTINNGIYPRVKNIDCTEETDLTGTCAGHGGEVSFTKIRIDINTMEVSRADKTFANVSSNEEYFKYGIAYDCYTEHPNNELRCGTKGTFNIDLRGTGWKVSDDQQWSTYDWQPMIESIDRQMNGTVINIRCGGMPGGCSPGTLFLKPFPEGIS